MFKITKISFKVYFVIGAAGEDFMEINRTLTLTGPQVEELITINVDSLYEGSDEKFMLLANLEGGSLEQRVFIQPSFTEITIQDGDPRPGGSYFCIQYYNYIVLSVLPLWYIFFGLLLHK